METKKIILDEKYVLEYIKDILSDMCYSPLNIHNAKYHHNSSYKDAPSICKHGILTMQDLRNLSIKEYSDDYFKKMENIEEHVNGTDNVSLSIVGLTDIYAKEDEYNPLSPFYVDFLVNSDLQSRRSSINYGNEFLVSKSIDVKDIRSVDIRLLELIKKQIDLAKIIDNYNYLKELAFIIKSSQYVLPLREMSCKSNSEIDIDKLANTPQLILKPKNH